MTDRKKEFMLAMGARVRRQREAVGLSQEELAKRLGYGGKSSISRIESGLNEIPQSKMAGFASALDTTIEYLMGWENVPRAKPEGLSPEEMDLILCFRRADERDKNTVRNVLERYREDTALTAG